MSTIVTRAGKGSALTHNEVDANFTNLNTDKLQSGNTAASLTITSADINGGTIDGTAIGGASAAAGAFTTLSAIGVTTVQAGSAVAPAITTSGDTNTGIFFPAADTIAFSEGGAEAMRINSGGNVGIGITPTQKLHVSGNILASGSIDCGTQFLGLSTDTATAPSFSFTGDTNTGMYRPGADQVALTTGGIARFTVNTSQFTGTLPWRGQNGTAAAPAFSASDDTNTGIYFPGADRIGFTEGGVQVGEFDASANFKFNSGYGSVATAYGCRAWVNFNGTGTVAIRASGNVSSITDGGVGDYTVNFTTAMVDANYSVQLASGDNNSGYAVIAGLASGNTAGAAKVATLNGGFSARQDSAYVFVAVFR